MGRLLVYVNLMAGTTYYLLKNGIGPSILDANGFPVYASRYIEWVTTCPSLILVMGELANEQGHGLRIAVMDSFIFVFGFLGILPPPYGIISAVLSLLFFFRVMYGILYLYKTALADGSKCIVDRKSLMVARAMTLCCWAFFPITHFSVNFKLVSYYTGEILFCFADLGAKVLLTLVLVNSTIEQAHSEKMDDVMNIAGNIRSELSSADKLLHKMMPEEVLKQLKTGNVPNAEEYESVTVFFSDITNFTDLSSKTSPKDMINTLNKLWREYDTIAEKWGMYKVETIGDAYLGVMGCPEKDPDHAQLAVEFSLDIMEMLKTFKTAMGSSIAIRVGLHSGPITCGVLGDLNPHWCIVGDTVNTASRMESTSEPMRIHISEATHKLLKKRNFILEGPVPMEIKGKGAMVIITNRTLIGSTDEKINKISP